MSTYRIGDACPTCASGLIGQSGHNYRCGNCGWLGPQIDLNTPERGGLSFEGSGQPDDRGNRATEETGANRPAAPVSDVRPSKQRCYVIPVGPGHHIESLLEELLRQHHYTFWVNDMAMGTANGVTRPKYPVSPVETTQPTTACRHDWVSIIGGIRCVSCGVQIAARCLPEEPNALRAPEPHDPLCRVARGGSCNCKLASEKTSAPVCGVTSVLDTKCELPSGHGGRHRFAQNGGGETSARPVLKCGDPVTFTPRYASKLPRRGWVVEKLPEPVYVIRHTEGSMLAVLSEEISAEEPTGEACTKCGKTRTVETV